MSNKVLIRRIMEQKEDAQNTTYTREEAINLLDNRGFKTLEELEEYFKIKVRDPAEVITSSALVDNSKEVRKQAQSVGNQPVWPQDEIDFGDDIMAGACQNTQRQEIEAEEDIKMFPNPVDKQGSWVSGSYIKDKYKDIPEAVKLILENQRLPLDLFMKVCNVDKTAGAITPKDLRDKLSLSYSEDVKKQGEEMGLTETQLLDIIERKKR